MKLETKQTEVRLVAESDIDKFYLSKFFNTKKKLFIYSEEEFGTNDTFAITLTYEKPE